MFSKISVIKSDKNNQEAIKRLKQEIETSDAVIIGAGAGLSTSAGFIYTGERFQTYFSDFEEKYGFHDMYSGGFYPYNTMEEHWAYWSRYIYINRYMDAPKPVYDKLYHLVKDKDYFVLTTNVDHCFQKAGFDKKRMFYTQGDYGLFQCSEPCHNKTYDNEEMVRKMVEAQGFAIRQAPGGTQAGESAKEPVGTLAETSVKISAECFTEKKENTLIIPKNGTFAMSVPTELVPRCPECGKLMSMNLRADNTFVEDEGWHMAAERYSEFLRRHQKVNVLFLELGVGYNTPGIIKYNFWKMTDEWENAAYACLNYGEAYAPDEIKEKSVCIDDDIGNILEKL
jgi:NAD-dependent SIR2 family protein deacetylase